MEKPSPEVIVHMTPASSKTPNPGLPPPAAKLRRSPVPPIPKPKSRFVELNCPPLAGNLRKSHSLSASNPLPSSSSDSSDDDEEDRPFSDKFLPEKHLRRRLRQNIGIRATAEALALVPTAALLILILSVESLRHYELWGVEIWRWCVVLMSVFSGRLVSGWAVWAAAFFIERRFPLHEKVLYFAFGLRKGVRGCVWLALVLLAWCLALRSHGGHGAASSSGALRRISRGLVAVLVACTIWLVKITLVKLLASSFHVATFFDRMKESVFQHYVLEALSGEPGKVDMEGKGRGAVRATRSMAGKVDMDRLRRLSRAGASACSVKRLVAHVMRTGLSLGLTTFEKQGDSDISDEAEAMAAAQRIFRNVAGPSNKYIDADDLRRFLTEEEVQTIFPLFEGAIDSGKIKK